MLAELLGAEGLGAGCQKAQEEDQTSTAEVLTLVSPWQDAGAS